MSKFTLVIARYREDLDWILKIPEHYHIHLYNKGPAIQNHKVLDRCTSLETLVNQGQEADTYLHHILNGTGRDSEKTIFCQGDPFDHSPDFLSLLSLSEQWMPTQALSYCWNAERGIPPAILLEKEVSEHLGKCRVRRELFSLATWAPFSFDCCGSIGQGKEYLGLHSLPGGWNIAGHFLEMCGLETLAQAAWEADLGKFTYGAIFATETARLGVLNEKALERMLILARSHPLYGFIFERMWLHFFGEPFIRVI